MPESNHSKANMIDSIIIPCNSCQSLFRVAINLIRPAGSQVRCSKCKTVFKVTLPYRTDQRKHKRVKTQNLISYFSYDKNNELISHGLGVALDISKGGILLETPYQIKSGALVLGATDRKRNLFEVRGKLAYSKKTSAGTYLSGIEFVGLDARVKEFITKLIKEYKYQGYDLFIAIAKHMNQLDSVVHS
jgi:predicted Zn finger-like uncharacterized protein